MIFGPQFIHISSAPGGGSGSGTAVVTPAILGLVKTLNNKLFATSADGNIYESSDNGATWSNVSAVSTALHNQHTYSVNEESARLSFSDTSLDLVTFDGTNNVSTVNFTTSSNPLQFLKKIGSRYYASESVSGGNALYYTTDSTLTTGWTSLGTGTASRWIEEGNGVEIRDNGGTVYRSTDGFATSTALYGFATTSAPQLITDGNDNWIRLGGSNAARISTDNGANWTNKYIIEAGGSYPNDIIYQKADTSGNAFYHDGNFYFMNTNYSNNYTPPNRAYKLPVSELSNTYPEATVLYDFNVSSNPALSSYTSVMPLYISYTNNYAYISAYDNNQGSYTPLLFSFQLSQPSIPSQTVTPSSSSSIFAFKTSEPNNSNNYIEFQSNEHTTPAESKRLWNLGDGIVDASLQLWPDTSTLAAGTVLYYGSTLTTLAFDPSAWVTHTRNSYVYYIINSNATNQYNVNPASVDYWVKVDTATSTIVHIYADADVTANTLKDVTSNVGSGGTVGPNGAIFFGDGNTAYSTYTGALNANISNQDYAYQIYIDSEDKYPKVGDRPYITTTSKSSNIWGGGAGQWFPFLVEGTTSSGSVSYAIQMGYASWDGSNISTTSPGSSNNVFITEIRDSNGNSVTEIQDPPPLITASGSAQLGYLVQNGTNGFLISTSSNHQTPTEAKRLYATSDSPDMAGSLYAYFSGTFQVGTVLYSSPSQATTFAGAYTAGYMTNDYAHFAVKADGGSWAGSDPSNFYWVTIQKSNSTVTAITENINVSANVLKDVGTNTSGLPNSSYGGFVLNNSAYNSYTTALAASLTSSQNLSVFYDGPGSYPKTHDRIYTASTGQQSFAATIPGGIGWHPFTTTGSSIDYAVQIGYASSSGTNSNTLPRANSTDLWISEIRDSNGNIVTEITTPVPMGWFANASDEYSAFSTRSDACSGGFANSTSIRVHFKTTTGTIAYPTTTQDIIDGSLSGSGTTLDMYNDSNGSPSTKFRGGALYVGLVYKPISNQNTSTQPQLTLTALGSSADVPSYSSEGMYNSVQSCP